MGARAVLRATATETPLLPQPELFSLEEEPGGGRPAPLSEVAGRQGKVEQHVLEDLCELAPLVQILDLPVPQLVDNVLDALRIPERPMAVQIIEVPKILTDVTPARSLVPESQTAEQLVEVPTVLSPTRIALQIAEQIVGHSSSAGSWRVQQRRPSSSSLTFLSLVEVFLVLSLDRVQQRGLSSRSLTFLLLVVALDRGLPHLLVLQLRILLGFLHFSPGEKSADLPGT